MEIIKVTWEGFGNGNRELYTSEKTYFNLEQAIFKLEPFLWNLGVKLCFEKKAISHGEGCCSKYRILIDGEPIENIIHIGSSWNLAGTYTYNEVLPEQEIPEHVIITAVLTRVKEKAIGMMY
ncbi:MAG: DUF2703 domain-containing protein [Thermodesulfobacteria bacterium]|nr:DUF2703 domain-containing protein [Thermodesulfobacteriota bacterium]